VEYEIERQWARSELYLEALSNFDILGGGGRVERRIGLARRKKGISKEERDSAKTNQSSLDGIRWTWRRGKKVGG